MHFITSSNTQIQGKSRTSLTNETAFQFDLFLLSNKLAKPILGGKNMLTNLRGKPDRKHS